MDQAGLSPEEKKLIAHLKDGYRSAITYNLASIAYELQRDIEGDSVIDDAAFIVYLKPALKIKSET